MRKRTVMKQLRNPKRCVLYGLERSRGHRSRRRGRRSILRVCPELRDHSHLSNEEQFRLGVKAYEHATGEKFDG